MIARPDPKSIWAGIALGLILTEAVLRIVMGSPRAALERQPNYQFDYGMYDAQVRDAGSGRLQVRNSNEYFAKKARPNNVRVFIAGESAAIGFLDNLPRWTYAFAARLPRRTTDAANFGQGGYEVSRIRVIVRQILKYKPAYLVLFIGNNSYQWVETVPDWSPLEYRPAWELYRNSWIFRALLGIPNRLWRTDRAHHREKWQSDYRDIVRIIQRAGTRPVLCTLPVNMHFPPLSAAFPWEKKEFFLAHLFYEDGRYARSEQQLDILSSRADFARHPAIPYLRGLIAEKKGDLPAARRWLTQAVTADDAAQGGNRATRARNEFVRQTAAESGAIVLDAEALFDAALRIDEQVAGRAFRDHCHWYRPWFILFEKELARLIAEKEGRGPQRISIQRPARLDNDDLRPSKEQLRMRAVKVLRAMINQQSHQGEWRVYALRPCVAQGVLAGLLTDKRGMLQKAYADLPSISQSRQEKSWTQFLLFAGEALRREGDSATARRCFSEVLDILPHETMALIWRGLACRSAGDMSGAVRDWQAAAKQDARFLWLTSPGPGRELTRMETQHKG